MKKSKRVKLLERALEIQERNYTRLVMHLMEQNIISRGFDIRAASRLGLKEWATEDIRHEFDKAFASGVPLTEADKTTVNK